MTRTVREVMEHYRGMDGPDGHTPRYPMTDTPVRRKEARLAFRTNELLYDIAQLAYVEGDVMTAESDHERHSVMDITEDGNRDRVTRVIDLAVAECRERLYPYSRVPAVCGTERDNRLEETGVYEIRLLLPDGFSETTLDYMGKLVHEYIVCRVMADWMSIANIANRNSAENWAARLPGLMDEIGAAVNRRIRRVRRTQTPF